MLPVRTYYFTIHVTRFMYTGQLDIGEGSVPSLVTTAQFLDMPLLEQLLQTHALASTTSTSSSPVAMSKVQRTTKAPVKTNYSVSTPKSVKASPKCELLPAGPSRIDLEVEMVQLKLVCLFFAVTF